MVSILKSAEATTFFRPLAALMAAVALISCSFSPPGAPAGSRQPPLYVLKFVPYSQDEALVAYFTLANAATNQVAAAGQLRLQVFTQTQLSLGSGPGMTLRNILYDDTFSIGATNFHWETYGSLFRVNDLAFRFVIPYSLLKKPVRKGRVVTIQMKFWPDGATNVLEARRSVSLY